VLIVTSAARNLVREQKVEQIQLTIQTGGKYGMQTMNQSLAELYRKGRITYQEAVLRSLDVEDLKRLLQRGIVASV
jgi:twitching motility protein PilT